MVWAALRLMEFFYHESCGKCSPCRKAVLARSDHAPDRQQTRADGRRNPDRPVQNIAGRTVCAFGDAEVSPILSTLKHWRHEYVTMIHAAGAANFDPAGTGRSETLTSLVSRCTNNGHYA